MKATEFLERKRNKVTKKIKRNIVNLGSDKTKQVSVKAEVKKAEVKDTKPKAIRDTFDAYHIENGSLASQVIRHILDCNGKDIDVTMKDIKNKFGNTFYSIFCRLEERKLAHREGKLLYVHKIEGNKIAKLVLPIIKPRVGANDYLSVDESKKITQILASK